MIFLTGARIGEVTALRRSDIEDREPLRRVLYARSYNTKLKRLKGTKTETAKEVPEHPTLRTILDQWWASGWKRATAEPRRPTISSLPSRSTASAAGASAGRL